ncbi:ABC transporter ATP-binding protein [Bacillus shivajii]|uniref:ABC transporter ATP-binding protein n=1 Tax=Bacillus shivajii TaxID=1983719 RepID=UPI001CFB4ACB|nr:ABC transporter ATP-binding protein [Bacillus shivajii]UCZ51563.1 ABC transporter ATP-binding protein [Bacillus shivajii]
MMTPTIKLNNVTKRYGRQDGIDFVDLSLEGNGIIGLVGPNGSGKSTLLKLISGFIRPTNGTVHVMGQKVTRNTAHSIAYLAEIDSLYDFQTVSQLVQFCHGAILDFSLEKAENMLDGLKVNKTKKIKHLSKGNRARVKIAMTLARDVPIYVMDEPLSGLDPIVREDILRLIVANVEVERQMLILSTHEVKEVEPFLDHIICMNEGSVALDTNVEQLKEERGIGLVDVMKEVLS